MNHRLLTAYAECEALTRTHARNFYHGLRLLPEHKRRALYAVYAVMRQTDDITDSSASGNDPRGSLEQWRSMLHAAYLGNTGASLVLPAFHDAVSRYGVPLSLFDELIDGVAMDLTTQRFETWCDLRHYCYLVAGVVGLVCIHIWGVADVERARSLAIDCGIAFQLTNILRDIREDAMRGRVYVPIEDLRRYGLTDSDLLAPQPKNGLADLIRFEAERAEGLYGACRPLAALIHPDCRPTFLAMSGIYRALLNRIRRDPLEVLHARVTVPPFRKMAIVAGALFRTKLGHV